VHVADTYESLPLLGGVSWNTPLYPKGERVYNCIEYQYFGDGWYERDGPGLVGVSLENQIGIVGIENNWIETPRLDIDLSENVHSLLGLIPSEDPSLTAIFEITITVDPMFPYRVGVNNIRSLPEDRSESFWKPNPSDSRLFVKESYLPLIEPGRTVTEYILIDKIYSKPSKICFTLSAPYIKWETVCIAT